MIINVPETKAKNNYNVINVYLISYRYIAITHNNNIIIQMKVAINFGDFYLRLELQPSRLSGRRGRTFGTTMSLSKKK